MHSDSLPCSCSLPEHFLRCIRAGPSVKLLTFFFPLTQITVSVEGLPGLGKGEAYSCLFQDTETPASFTDTGVICSTPDASSLPPIGHGDGECFVLSISNCTQLAHKFIQCEKWESSAWRIWNKCYNTYKNVSEVVQIDLTWQLFFFFIFNSNAEFVMVTLSLRFVNVTVAETEFTFYNCSLVQQLSGRRP